MYKFQIFIIVIIAIYVQTDILDLEEADDDIDDRDSNLLINLEDSQLSESVEKTPIWSVRFNENNVDLERVIPRSKHPLLRDMKVDDDDYEHSDPITQSTPGNFSDTFRMKLTMNSAVYRAISIQKDFETNSSLLYINSYAPTLEKDGYSYIIVKTADHVYFSKTMFEELIKFLYSNDTVRMPGYKNKNVQYSFVKHFEIPGHEYVTLYMRITIDPTKSKIRSRRARRNGKIVINKGILLNMKEYNHLVSRAFQLLKEMEFN